MATVQDVIKQYKPELDLEEPVSAEDAVAHIVENSDLEAATVEAVFNEVSELLYWYLIRGRPVTLPGVGQVRPTIDLDGTIRAALQADESLVARMSEPEAYRAGIDRRENIGASLRRLGQMWNSTHPNDPVRDL
ncbi:MAG: hypothetical protein ACLFWD_00530 [Anaerolineales bacterium]